MSHGYELAGATSFNSENPVYMLVGSASEDVAADGGSPTETEATDGGQR